MRQKLRNNGLSLAVFGLFLAIFVGQILVGRNDYNADRKDWGQQAVSLPAYLTSGHFVEATFENWESEFLQMGVYVLLTAFLFQKGSSESKDPDKPQGSEDVNTDPRDARDQPDAPGPVQRGGLILKLYENSLSIALLSLFALSFTLHALGGMRVYNEEQQAHGEPAVSLLGFLGTSRFWFQSLQNWQSEFLSIGVLVVLSIYLRQKGSPESKPVAAPHSQTGDGD